MTIQYHSPYHRMLAGLMKDDDLTEIERKILDVLLLDEKSLTCRDLVGIVFGEEPGRNRRINKNLEKSIREGIEELQNYGVPIIVMGRGEYRLGNNLDPIEYLIQHLESQIRHMQDRVDKMRVYYGRQLKPFERLRNESKQSH